MSSSLSICGAANQRPSTAKAYWAARHTLASIVVCSTLCMVTISCAYRAEYSWQQGSVQDGVKETGVSIAFTVRAMDAGPVLAQESVAVGEAVQAPELLEDLFRRGTALLIRHLPSVFDGRAQQQATPQVRSLL